MCLNRTFNDINFNVRINNFHFLNTELIKGNKYIKSKNVDMLRVCEKINFTTL